MGNLFADLSKHLSKKHEDFLTNSFVYLIDYLLSNEKALGLKLLNTICSQDTELKFGQDKAIKVIAQKSTDEGTPDIEIRSKNKCIYIEVKHDSGLGYKQIERYKRATEKESGVLTLNDQAPEGLAPDLRDTVHLHYYQELTLQETADAMNVAASTVKYRLRQALGELEKQLDTDGSLSRPASISGRK